MGPIEAIKTCLSKSFQFSGRASRAEFWWFAPAYFLVVTFCWFSELLPQLLVSVWLMTVTQIFLLWLMTLMPVYAVTSRRLRDAGGQPAWLWLMPLYLLTAIPLALVIDSSSTWGVSHPARGLPEMLWMFFGLISLIVTGFILCLLPTKHDVALLAPNPHEVPS